MKDSKIQSKSVLHELYYRLKKNGKFWKTLKVQLEMQFLDVTDLQDIQLRKLNAILKHAYDNVPLYTEKFDRAKVSHGSLQSLSSFSSYPIAIKEELRENFPGKTTAKGFPSSRLLLDKTSGSTNQPFEFYKDAQDAFSEDCARFKWLLNSGYRMGDRRLLIRGEPTKDMDLNKPNARLRFISAFDMNDESFAKWEDFIDKFRPSTIESYPSPLVSFANCLKLKDHRLSVPIIITIGEMLSDRNRKLIEDRFNGKIFDSYGCSEAMYVAQECSFHDGLHYDMARFIIECVDSKGRPVKDGHEGDILITNLDNYAMPFIRYKIGDRGTMSIEKCPCGISFHRIKSIKGRAVEQIRMRDGSILDFPYLATLFERETKDIREFQLIYRKNKKLTAIVCLRNEKDKKTLSTIRKSLKDYVKGNVRIEVIEAKKIPLGRTGKRIFVKIEN